MIRYCDSHTLASDYDSLTPEIIMSSVEQCGYLANARMIALNSYENRVYQVGVEDHEPLIIKFYRPQRWTDEQILEEHTFSQELTDAEIPVISPLLIDSATLHQFQGFRFALYHRRGGYAPELDNFEHLHFLGRLLGRIHAVGRVTQFKQRPTLNIDTFCRASACLLVDKGFIPAHRITEYQAIINELADRAEAAIHSVDGLHWLRTHGDCHLGNILWHRDQGPHFVDFDDCRMAPAVQDLWMLLAGDHLQQSHQLSEILAGYTEFQDFNGGEIRLIETLRGLRLVHYAAWLGKRWNDPAFPKNFIWFNTPAYWEQHINELRQQVERINEQPLSWY